MDRIAIIGLGLIGGSIGLALKRGEAGEFQVAGCARTRDTVQRAKKMGAIDVEAHGAAEAARGARLVIVASPIMTVRGVFEQIAPVLVEGAVVTDVASTKAGVARLAAELLPAHAQFVGGHPMAGKERQGIDEADGELFRGKPWVIAPSVSATESAVSTVIGLARVAGAEPIFMDAEEHDSYAAAISHLPLVLSSALFSVAFGSAAWPELAKLASSGFRDTTRLASGSPEMAHDIVLTNRENVVHWIDRYMDELYRFRQQIAAGESKEVIEMFARPQLERDNFMVNGPPSRQKYEPIETLSMSDVLFGSKVGQYMKRQREILKDMESRENGKPR